MVNRCGGTGAVTAYISLFGGFLCIVGGFLGSYPAILGVLFCSASLYFVGFEKAG